MADALVNRAEDTVFANYNGTLRNADPNYSHFSSNRQPVTDWTQNKMEEYRRVAAEKK